MRPPSLPTLGERYGLGDRQLDQLDAVLCGLAEDEHAPTTVRDAKTAMTSISPTRWLRWSWVLYARRAGSPISVLAPDFPDSALAVALPGAEVTLVESQARKCAFIERLRTAAAIENARVVCTRAEEWREGMRRNDVVVARALAAQPVVLEYAAPLLEHGGVLVDWRGRRDSAQEAEAACAAEQLGLRLLEIRRTEPYEGARDHHLHVFEKVAETPARFPRRVGVARKRPLGC